MTNPPLDAIREEVVTAVASTIGPEANLLEPGPENCRQLVLPFPIIDNDELAKIIHAAGEGGREEFVSHTVRALNPETSGGVGLERRLEEILKQAIANAAIAAEERPAA